LSKKTHQELQKKSSKTEEMGFFKTIFLALICATIVRSLFFEPFYIPSSSMKPNLLIGDYMFVSKYSYGYSRYSFPLGLKIFSGRIFAKLPKRGDIVVFRLPSNPSINYVKRLVGLPGDKIQMQNGVLFINEQKVEKIPAGEFVDFEGDKKLIYQKFKEVFPESLLEKSSSSSNESSKKQQQSSEFFTLDLGEKAEDDTGIYQVPEGHYFLMGDNRDNSQDSRFLSKVGFVPEENLVGKASLIFLSLEKPIWQFWNWPSSIRFLRSFTFPTS